MRIQLCGKFGDGSVKGVPPADRIHFTSRGAEEENAKPTSYSCNTCGVIPALNECEAGTEKLKRRVRVTIEEPEEN